MKAKVSSMNRKWQLGVLLAGALSLAAGAFAEEPAPEPPTADIQAADTTPPCLAVDGAICPAPSAVRVIVSQADADADALRIAH